MKTQGENVGLLADLTFAGKSSIINSIRTNIAGWSSLEARRAHNPEVIGSNPIPATTKSPKIK
mgnify:FL=1